MKKAFTCLSVLTVLLLSACGSDTPPAPDTAHALNYQYIKTSAGKLGSKTMVERHVQILPDPLSKSQAITTTQLAQTAIKAALTLHEEEPCDITTVWIQIDKDKIGTGQVLAKAVYIPSKEGADGNSVPVWTVFTAGKDIPMEMFATLPSTGLTGGWLMQKKYKY